LGGEETGTSGFFVQAIFLVFGLALVFTIALVGLSVPAGIYAFFFTHISPNPSYTWTFVGRPYLWIGPVVVFLPFGVSIGVSFLVLMVVYLLLIAYAARQSIPPLRAVVLSLRSGFASFFRSPLLVAVISTGFLIFTASLIDRVVSGTAPPSDPLFELWGLSVAPIVEEFGFRVVMIGLVAAFISLGRPWKEVGRALWRPSSVYEGRQGDLNLKIVFALLLVVAAISFGVAHILAGWTPGKFFEAAYGGVVLGYLYVRYGFHVAVLTHWGVDYFGNAFAFLGQGLYGIPWDSNTEEYILQRVVDFDMLSFFGVMAALVVLYLGIIALVRRNRPASVQMGPTGSKVGQV
jgi:hypothetical protein